MHTGRFFIAMVPVAVAFIACAGAPGPLPSRAAKPAPSIVVATAPVDAGALPPLAPVPTPEQICAWPQPDESAALPGAHTFWREDPPCPPNDPNFCDYAETSPDPTDLCFVANTNIRRAEADARATTTTPAPARSSAPWDHKAPPDGLLRVEEHLSMTGAERARLQENGFVVMDRVAYDSYATAFHEIFRQELPVYVGVDAILHAVFQANGSILQDIETHRLGPKLVKMLPKLRSTLRGLRARYGDETARDLDVYLTTANALLEGSTGDQDAAQKTLFGDDALVATLVDDATGAGGLQQVTLFGRDRMIDFSQYTPRGFYANPMATLAVDGTYDLRLSSYFQAMMWLSRLELNLVSRSCRSSQPGDAPDPSETPREARVALALADLVELSGELQDLADFDETYRVFAGRREDVPVPDLLRMMHAGGFGPRTKDAPDRLKTAIGAGFVRTARIHYMPEGTTTLPVIATLFGPRIAPDTAPLTRLVNDSVPDRTSLGAADVAYVLGHDRAKRYLKDDLKAFPTLSAALDGARAELDAGLLGKTDLYGLWLGAVRALAQPDQGVLPSFMRTEAWADARMGSALVGYGQIRHNYVLLAGQGYDAYGCEIPDGWVEPAAATYDALLAYARAARAVDPGRPEYWDRVTSVLSMLRAIVATELSGAALTEPQRRWLGMVSELIPVGGYGDSGEPPKWTGWYFDLFPDRNIGGEADASFVADYFTLSNAGRVQYLGAKTPRLGVFVVDTNGAPRAMVGPVARGYEVSSPIASRLTDEAARDAPDKSAPWMSSYLERDALVDMDFQITPLVTCPGDQRFFLESEHALGPVSLVLLDHHGDPITGSLTRDVGPKGAVFAFHLPKELVPPTRGIGVEFARVTAEGPARSSVVSLGMGRMPTMFPGPTPTRGP